MKYTYKERVRMARKLKVFLAVFFAATIFFTGKVILDKTFAADNDYGTATVTFNAGADGQFEDGTTTNTVTYNLTKKTIKTSHTPNISDDGTQNGDVSTSANYTDIVTIPGASSIHVKVVYGGGVSDYLSVIRGEVPNPVDFIGGDMVLDRFSGYEHTMPGATREYDIPGNSVTFLYYTYSSYGRLDGYGYHAIVSGETENGDLALGSIASGEYKEPIGNGNLAFTNWNQELILLNSNTTVTANYRDKIAGGTSYQAPWVLKANGELVIGTENTSTFFRTYSNMQPGSYPWFDYKNYVKKVKFIGTVNAYNLLDFMFTQEPILTEVDFTNFNTTNVVSMYDLFGSCYKLQNIIFSSINTSNVTNMGLMFKNCTSLTTLDLTQLNTSNVTGMRDMFEGCNNLTNIDFSSFDTSNVTDMSGMFSACNKLSSIDLSYLDTSNVTDMSGMFAGCSSLRNIDLTPLDTSNVTSMLNMFDGCTSLTAIDVSSFDTSNVETINGMFSGCYGLTNINFGNFYTENVVDMRSMFSNCEGLTSLDLSSFDTNNVTDMRDMFFNTPLLDTITFGEEFICVSLISLEGSWQKLNSNPIVVLYGEDFNYSSNLAGTYIKVDKCFAILYEEGKMVFQKGNQPRNSEEAVIGVYEINELEDNFSSPDEVPWKNEREDVVRVSFSYEIIKPISTAYWFFGMKNLEYIDSFIEGSSYSFVSYLDTSETINMECMFYGCEKLKKLDLSGLKTSNVTNMNSMFANCISLREIMFYNCRTLTPAPSKFFGNSNIKATLMNDEYDNEENVQEFDTSNVTDMGYMFYNCKSLAYLDLATIRYSGSNDDENLQPSFNMNNDYKVKFLDYGSETKFISDGECEVNSIFFDTSNVEIMEGMFSGCEMLLSLDISSFDTSSILFMSDMFFGTSRLKTLKLGENFSFIEETGLSKSWQLEGEGTVYSALQLQQMYDGSTMAGIYEATDLVCAIIYSNGDMVFQEGNAADPTKGEVLGIYTGFEEDHYDLNNLPPWYDCGNNVEKVIFTTEVIPMNTARWFYGFYDLKEIENIEYLNTVVVEDMTSMFSGCISLNDLDLSSLKTDSVTDMYAMFEGCESLVVLDLSSWDTSSVTDFVDMFYDCVNLSILDLSTFDGCTKRGLDGDFYVPSLDQIFYNTPELRVLSLGVRFSFNGLNSGLAGAWQRDGDSTVYRAEDLMSTYDGYYMAGIYRRTTPPIPYVMIYSNGDMVFQLGDDVDSSRGNLLASYTDFEGNNYDGSYVPWEDYKHQITKVEFIDRIYPISTAGWFSYMNNLTIIDNIEYLNTSKVENMSYMFSNCEIIEYLDLSSFNTSGVQKMGNMFYDCFNLEILDISTFDTSSVKDMSYMFYGCTNLVNLDISSFDTSSIFEEMEPYQHYLMDYMFSNMYNLRILTLGEKFDFKDETYLDNSWQRDGDDTIYTASQLQQAYDGSTMAGTYRAILLLEITEEVRGSIANTNKDFTFTINVMKNGNGINGNQSYTGTRSGNLRFNNGVATFTLKHGENIIINLNAGVEYTITQNSDGYTVAKTNDTGTLDDNKTASFINTLNGTTPTGIFLDLIPYIIILITSIGLIVFIKKTKYI